LEAVRIIQRRYNSGLGRIWPLKERGDTAILLELKQNVFFTYSMYKAGERKTQFDSNCF
jgi:hypothetical protein